MMEEATRRCEVIVNFLTQNSEERESWQIAGALKKGLLYFWLHSCIDES